MRNLRVIHRSDINCSDITLPLTATTWESTDALLCAFGPSPARPTIELYRCRYDESQYGPPQLITSWDAHPPSPDHDCDQIINFQYFPDTNSCCLVLESGDIVVVREQPLSGEEHIEILGTVDYGISAAAWSPDEGYLAIYGNDSSFILMSREFEPIADYKFSLEDIKASKHVSVGWGKAETQFKGKRAKALRDPTVPEKVDEGVPSLLDDARVTITWRGDGEYLAINSFEVNGKRMIRVFSKEGILDSVAEPVDYLEGALSWRPAGNLMAGIKRSVDHAEVVFFERNGLRHGQFPLRLSETELQKWGSVIGLDWNTDSTALAITFKDRVQIWTMGNYHYYLKQSIRLPSTSTGHVRVCWSTERPLLTSIYHSNTVLICELAQTISQGSTIAPHDIGIVAVIDGTILKVTPFRYANVPPPMSLFEILLDSEATDVSINSQLKVISVLREKSIDVFSYSVKKGGVHKYGLIKTFDIEEDCGIPRQIICTNSSQIFALCNSASLGNRVFHIDLVNLNSTLSSGQSLAKTASTIALSSDGSGLFAQQSTGRLFRHDHHMQIDQRALPQLPAFCPWAELVDRGDFFLVLGLSRSGMLYANDRLLVRNCTSFLVTALHLIFTTSNQLLKFVHLAAADELEVPLDEPEKDERCRSIERGAKLVTVVPSAFSLIMQMPRGNLETIYPRALVLAGIRRSIDKQDYKSAFMACRSQRVDMNIIHDHNPEVFMRHIHKFITQISKVEHIDLFLSQLRDEDVTETMYRDTMKKMEPKPDSANVLLSTAAASSKINTICDAFLKELEAKAETNLQNTVTAHVCKTPPDLDGGLTIISKLKGLAQQKAEEAAEHICFLADANQLYDHALGIYDLDVALLIAQQSQKDPREYLPYIQSLQEMPLLRRKYAIDNDLKRYAKALSYLHELDEFEELQLFTQKHELYSAAMELYKYRTDKLDVLMRLYANSLKEKRSFKTAGIAYEYLSDYAAALQSYRQANLWREAIYCAQIQQWPSDKIANLATELAEALEESKDLHEAAQIHIDYLNDIETGMRLLCKTYQFAEATRIAVSRNKAALLETTVDAGLVECFNTTTELLADCKSQLNAQVPRLRELRVKKEQEPLAFYAGDPSANADGDIPDDISLAPTEASTSGGTFMTRYTNRTNGTLNTQTTRRTSKNRRREERKRARGKKGSVYEEEYLINSIGRLIERINSVNDDVVRLVEGLTKRRMREQAAAVENVMLEVIGMCNAIVGEVFGTTEISPETSETNGFDRAPTGGNAVLHDAIEAVKTPKVAPTIKAFERLSLVG